MPWRFPYIGPVKLQEQEWKKFNRRSGKKRKFKGVLPATQTEFKPLAIQCSERLMLITSLIAIFCLSWVPPICDSKKPVSFCLGSVLYSQPIFCPYVRLAVETILSTQHSQVYFMCIESPSTMFLNVQLFSSSFIRCTCASTSAKHRGSKTV